MSEFKVKEEPVDKGYEQVEVNQVDIKKEKNAEDEIPAGGDDGGEEEEDDLAWVNEELDFLNEIEYEDNDTPGDNDAEMQSEQKDNAPDKDKVDETLAPPVTEESVVATQPMEETEDNIESEPAHEQESVADNEQNLHSTNSDISRTDALLAEIQKTADTVERLRQKQQEQDTPVRIKQEKLTPPREIPPLTTTDVTTPHPPSTLDEPINTTNEPLFVRRIKEEKDTEVPPPAKQPEASNQTQNQLELEQKPPQSKSPERRKSRSRSRSPTTDKPPQNPLPTAAVTSRTLSKSSLQEDAAFLSKQRDRILKEKRKNDQLSTSKDQPPAKRRELFKDMPLPVRIKSEPMDCNDNSSETANVRKISSYENSGNVDSELQAPPAKSPVVLRVMPLPFKIKEEPKEDAICMAAAPPPPIKIEKWDDQPPISDRRKVVKFVRETVKNFEFFETNPKLRRRFLYTPTTLIREDANKLAENRSPLSNGNGIRYEFSSHGAQIETEKFGVCKLSDRTAAIVRLLGFNIHEFSERIKLKTQLKMEREEETSQKTDSAAYFVNAECQTDELRCNKCIVRKLKRFADKETQVSLTPAVNPPSTSNLMYENVSHSMLHTLSQLVPAQQTAIKEFVDLVLGPAPMSTNEVMRMRENLMDIFTLAQSQGNNGKVRSNPLFSSKTTPTSVLFNQREQPRQIPTRTTLFPPDAPPHRPPAPPSQYIPPQNYHPQSVPSQQYMPPNQGIPTPVPSPYAEQSYPNNYNLQSNSNYSYPEPAGYEPPPITYMQQQPQQMMYRPRPPMDRRDPRYGMNMHMNHRR